MFAEASPSIYVHSERTLGPVSSFSQLSRWKQLERDRKRTKALPLAPVRPPFSLLLLTDETYVVHFQASPGEFLILSARLRRFERGEEGRGRGRYEMGQTHTAISTKRPRRADKETIHNRDNNSSSNTRTPHQQTSPFPPKCGIPKISFGAAGVAALSSG